MAVAAARLLGHVRHELAVGVLAAAKLALTARVALVGVVVEGGPHGAVAVAAAVLSCESRQRATPSSLSRQSRAWP